MVYKNDKTSRLAKLEKYWYTAYVFSKENVT